jgi:hypothetical protein
VGLFKRQSEDERFWAWFQRNSARLLDFEADRDAAFADLASALWRVDRGLAFEFGPAARPRDFVVSAEGIVELFPVVTRLVEAAPSMPDWHVIAFRQPGKPSLAVEFDGQSLGADDLWFRASRSGSRTNLEAHIRGLTEANARLLMGAAFILLDNALGEYVVATRVGAIDWLPLPEDPAAAGLIPLAALPEAVAT